MLNQKIMLLLLQLLPDLGNILDTKANKYCGGDEDGGKDEPEILVKWSRFGVKTELFGGSFQLRLDVRSQVFFREHRHQFRHRSRNLRSHGLG